MKRKKKIPNLGFKIMVGMYGLIDLFHTPQNKIAKFDINESDVVVDYGCGPGRYVKKASELVGKTGKVYAVDIHKMAIQYVDREIEKYKLENVESCLVQNGTTGIEDNSADVIFALDMFHHVDETEEFFLELHRIIKPEGILYLEDGHQARKLSKHKISRSNLWEIMKESSALIQLVPK